MLSKGTKASYARIGENDDELGHVHRHELDDDRKHDMDDTANGDHRPSSSRQHDDECATYKLSSFLSEPPLSSSSSISSSALSHDVPALSLNTSFSSSSSSSSSSESPSSLNSSPRFSLPLAVPITRPPFVLSRSWLSWPNLFTLVLFGYTILIPLILVTTYYISFLEALVAGIPAVFFQFLLHFYLTRHYFIPRLNARANAFSFSHDGSSNSLSSLSDEELNPKIHYGGKLYSIHASPIHAQLSQLSSSTKNPPMFLLSLTIGHWSVELYQLFLTLLSCSVYLFYTYSLSYDPISGDYDLDLPSLTMFVQVEYFIIVSFSIDYCLHFYVTQSHSKLRFLFNFYSLLDLCSFTGVAYFSFLHANFSPKDTYYNFYLFQGPFRFLRLRRALKSLDEPMRKSGGVVYKLGPMIMTELNAVLLLFTARVFLFLMSAAALVLAVEFPCAAFAPCTLKLQEFHLCVYFVVVSISTVGYGDITCVTDLGRMLMIFVIIGALIQVPKEMSEYHRVQNDSLNHVKQQDKKEESGRNLSSDLEEDEDSDDEDPNVSELSISSFSNEVSHLPREHHIELVKMPPIPEEKDPNAMPIGNSSTCKTPFPMPPSSSNFFDPIRTQPLAIWAELQLLRLHDTEFLHKLALTLEISASSAELSKAIVQKLFIVDNK